LRSATYGANNLNQYTNRTVSGAVDVMGIASAGATVTVNTQAVYRHLEYYRKELAISNTTTSLWQSVTNKAVQGATSNTVIGKVFLPRTPEVFLYDADGNLVSDGRWTNLWDAENRLVNMTSLTNSAPSNSWFKLDFTYDYMGRRMQKMVSTWQVPQHGTAAFTPVSTNQFIYDDWNVAVVLDAATTLLDSFAWGTDLSGTMQGAGGVGGVLALTVYTGTNAGTYFYCYDGNGNVAALVNATNGAIAAQYEYGPFGEVIRANGTLAKSNPFRFSTKYQDDESDLIYYGYRYYHPSLGRWLAKDPLNEDGGINLYASVMNNPINSFDYLGLAIECCNADEYFGQLGLVKNRDYRIATDQKTYWWNPAQGIDYQGSIEKEIVSKMLASKYHFKILDCKVENLRLHVTARKKIVDNALGSTVKFGQNTKIKRPTAQSDPDPDAHYAALNNVSTALGCQRWSEIIFETGNRYQKKKQRDLDEFWIPGDWAYIDNLNYNYNSKVWGSGLGGENVFAVRGELFWGLDESYIHPGRSKKWWWDHISNDDGTDEWMTRDKTQSGAPAWDKQPDRNVTFPGVGLEP
jgi:RHS repeat-associated protein